MAGGTTTFSAAIPQNYGNFDLVKHHVLDYTNVSVSKWRSRQTGLTMLHLDYDAPIVNGYFVVASEIFDDSGRPHTLEHLVFMGSDQFPYKGVLDQLANRAFSAGTNAWTATDHTAYTLSTAGSQGFLQMLPIYLDHILYPTLKKSGFVTEVHHIDPEGGDAGVVYSEMQGRQNTSSDLMEHKLQRLIHQPGSAYRSETAGLMEALRVLTNAEIKEYHQKYYAPYNLTIIVTGKISTQDILATLQRDVEPSILRRHSMGPVKPTTWRRPFLESSTSSRKPLEKTVKETVMFPEQDESLGELAIAFTGPSPTDFLSLEALDVLGSYLTSSATAPLNKEYIETSSPLCTYISLDISSRAVFCDLTLYVGGVPVGLLETFDDQLLTSLVKIADDGIDMDRMSMVLKREKRKFYSVMESSKGDAFSDIVIEDFLYGDTEGQTLVDSLNSIKLNEKLASWTTHDWSALIRKYFVNSPIAVVRGKPSAELAEQLITDEKSRVEEQIRTLGADGLVRAAKELQEAKAEHDLPIPNDIISNFKVPDVKSISWIPVASSCDTIKKQQLISDSSKSTLDAHISKDGEPLPFFVQFDNVQSDFVAIHVLFSLSKIPAHLLPYLSVYQTAFFSLPIEREDGSKLSHENVVDQLEMDTVSYDASLGFDGSFGQMFRVSLKVETASYETAVAWIRDLVFGIRFDPERLKVAVAKLQQSLPELKRDGETVMGSTAVDLTFGEASSVRANSLLSQMEFLPRVAEELQDYPERTISILEEMRQHFVKPQGIRVSVVGDILAIPKPRQPWSKIHQFQTNSIDPVPTSNTTLSSIGKDPARKAIIVALPSIESSFSLHITKGLQGFGHREHAALRVALELLNALESYFWRHIRGSGLAYGANVGADLEVGQVSFTIHRSPNSFRAFEEGARMLRGLASGVIELESTLLDAAKSSIVYSVARQGSTPGKAGLTSFINQALKGVHQDYHKQLLLDCQAVTKADVLDAIKRYLLPIFDPSSSVAVIVCAPSKMEEISKSFADYGFEIEQRTLDVEEESGSEGSTESDRSK